MARGDGDQEKVTGDPMVVFGNGVVICGEPCAPQFGPSGTLNVRCAERSGVQPVPRRATMNHELVPLGTCRVSVLFAVEPASVVRLPVMSQSSYSVAPVTALHENATGDVTVAPFAGARSDGGT